MTNFDFVKKIEQSPQVKKFFKENPEHYLVHIFYMIDSDKKDDFQLGYYSKKSDRITVIDYTNGNVLVEKPQEAFKEKNYIEKLVLDDKVISKERAEEIADEVIKKNYSAESLVRMIMLLQNIPEFGQIWNITVVTASFKVLNIKIESKTGEVLKHTRESLMGWNKSDK